jgi:hypothetical protein
MSRKKKRRRRPAARDEHTPSPIRKRRLPAPKVAGGTAKANLHRQTFPPEGNNPYVLEIVRLIEEISGLSRLGPHIILADFIGMTEAALRMWAANAKAMATTGKFVKDPPAIKEIYAGARARYTFASAKYPAVYRLMQKIFPQTLALLMESAGPGLEAYGGQSELNPDVIGQVFIACLRPGPDWLQFFPTWQTALAAAGQAVPDGGEVAYTALAGAALRARRAGRIVELEPGLNFEAWYETIFPYIRPVFIGPPLVDSGAMMLALAAQFPDWTVKAGLVEFGWDGQIIDPLLAGMISINAMLFVLNGYYLEQAETAAEILAFAFRRQQAGEPEPRPRSPAQLYRAAGEEEAGPVRRPTAPEGKKSFSELFRR